MVWVFNNYCLGSEEDNGPSEDPKEDASQCEFEYCFIAKVAIDFTKTDIANLIPQDPEVQIFMLGEEQKRFE